ncbi:hypothetical protein [Streptomyces sp. NPDC048659]|uniref:hypothetical protein n=1 Tax=Streptomyces sp. NPDC048659 TaxID=3155489 RepID=UPI0034312D84
MDPLLASRSPVDDDLDRSTLISGRADDSTLLHRQELIAVIPLESVVRRPMAQSRMDRRVRTDSGLRQHPDHPVPKPGARKQDLEADASVRLAA